MIVVVDYGVNNLRSVVRALQAAGHQAELSADTRRVAEAERLVLPGVGHFGQASRNLAASGLGPAVRAAAAAGRPVLGICLGLQLCFTSSTEAPGVEGLGLLPGSVTRFPPGLPVPHVGWAEVTPTRSGLEHPALAPLFDGQPPFFYHVHSYHPVGLPPNAVLATADYGGPFPTIVGQANVLGVQFHPEKSQHAGLKLLDGFARWAPAA